MPDTVRALLFDLDGTLVDTAAANAAAYGRALADAGVTVSDDALRSAIAGRHWRDFLPGLLGDARVAPEAIAARKKDIYPEMFGLVRVNAPLIALARSARPAFRTALVTTASRANVDAMLSHVGLASAFDVVVHGDDVTHHKPHPDAYTRAIELLGIAAAECLAFEDSDVGVESARRAGVGVVRVGW